MRLVTLAAIALLGGACSTAPAIRFDREAAGLGLAATRADGAGHPLRVYTHATHAGPRPHTGRLHVYLDGDGRPFVQPTRIARDPTPQDPLVLRMLAADPGPAVYLGRPCYHGLEPGCDARLWTVARYGDAVVDSMTAALAALIATEAPARVVLIGYSGGGALAALIAARLPAVDTVVTVAANLDVDAWTRLHGYTPLTESLDPAAAAVSLARSQLHYAGSQDRNVPPTSQAGVAARLPAGAFRIIEGFDHRCCWAETWTERLREIDALTAGISAVLRLSPPGH